MDVTSPVKIILSIDAVRYPLTGIGRYCKELASSLMKNPNIDEIKLLSGFRFMDGLPIVQEQADSQYHLKSWVKNSSLRTEIYRKIFPLLRKYQLKRFEDYIYHGPNFSLPAFPGPKVATFHDISPFTWSHCSTPERVNLAQKEALHTLSCANALITDSNFTRQEIAQYFNWPIERIHAVPLACSEDFHPRDESACLSVLSKYNLKYQGYSLYVGTIEPRKNLERLLEAYARLPLKLRMEYPLILSGYKGWNNQAILDKLTQAEHQGWARYLGFLPAHESPLLFSAAHLFCFPSHYEGFGLPVLEAMASGLPVLCSNSSSLPEVIGDAGFVCDAEDDDALFGLVQQGIEDHKARETMRLKALERAKLFSWSDCAEGTLGVYRKVLEGV